LPILFPEGLQLQPVILPERFDLLSAIFGNLTPFVCRGGDGAHHGLHLVQGDQRPGTQGILRALGEAL